MEFIFVILTTLSLLFVKSGCRQSANRLFLIFVGGYICLWLTISLFNPYDLYPVSWWIYAILCLGVISFFMGFVETRHNFVRSISNPLGAYAFQDKLKLFLDNKLFDVIFLLSFTLLLYLASTQWRLLLLQGGAGNLKLDFFELIFNGNSVTYAFYQFVVFPFFHFCCILFPILILHKGNKMLSIVLLFFMVLFAFVGGKRGYFMTIIEYFIVVFFLTKFKETHFGLFKWLKFTVLGLIAVVPMIIGAAYMTSISKNNIEGSKEGMIESISENAKNMIVYNIGSFRAFEYALQHDYLEQTGGYTYGRNFFGGAVDYYGAPLLQRVGIPVKRVREKGMSLLQENSIMVGKNTEFNFLYTAFLYFYFDAGLLGILVFSFLFGKLCLITLRTYNRYHTIGSLCLIAYLIIEGLLLNGSWFNISISAQPTLLLFYLMHRYERKRISAINSQLVINKSVD